MGPKKDEGKQAHSAASAGASNDAILAAINKYGAELAKVSTQVEELKNSMEDRLSTFENHLCTLQSEFSQTAQRLDGMDAALSDADVRMTSLEASCRELQVENSQLKAKLNDLEGRSRRLNIRIVGIKEGEENGNPTEFVSRLLPELLGPNNFAKPIKIDRAHRGFGPKPSDTQRPRMSPQ